MSFLIMMMITNQIKMCTCATTGLFYVLPDDSTNASCPSQPCATLSQLLLNISGVSNFKFLLLSGKHGLTSNVKIQHIHNVMMAGVGTIHSRSPSTIFCHSAEASITFGNSSNILITNLVFKNCGGTTAIPTFSYRFLYDGGILVIAAAYFSICYNCNIRNVTFIGYGLLYITELLGTSHLDKITLYLCETEHSYHSGITEELQ